MWRAMPTLALGSRSIARICGGVVPILALMYSPRSTPACLLLVAKVASTTVSGSVAVSSAITTTPCCLADLMAPSTPPVLLGVMRMPLTPCRTRFSIAVTCPSLSRVEPAGECEHLCAVRVGGGSCRITQLDEVRVGLRLRNETDLDRPAFPGAGAATPMALRGTPREHQQDEEQCRREHASRTDE